MGTGLFVHKCYCAYIYNDISYLNVSLLLYIYTHVYVYIYYLYRYSHRCRCHSYPWILVSSNALLSPIGRLGPFDDLFGHPRSASHRHPAQHAQQGAPMSLSENGVQPWWKLAAKPWEILQTLRILWWVFPLKMMVFHSYVSLPEGIINYLNMVAANEATSTHSANGRWRNF